MPARLTWLDIAAPFEFVRCWGAIGGRYQYVLTYNERNGIWRASTRMIGQPNDATIELGIFDNRVHAEAACEQHDRRHRSRLH